MKKQKDEYVIKNEKGEYAPNIAKVKEKMEAIFQDINDMGSELSRVDKLADKSRRINIAGTDEQCFLMSLWDTAQLFAGQLEKMLLSDWGNGPKKGGNDGKRENKSDSQISPFDGQNPLFKI